MEIDVYRWVLEQRELGLEVNDTDIQKRAHEIVGDDNFKASRFWCYNFRKRFSLVRRAVTHTSRKMTFTEEDVVSMTTITHAGACSNLVQRCWFGHNVFCLFHFVATVKTLSVTVHVYCKLVSYLL